MRPLEPPRTAGDAAELLPAFLDDHRDTLHRKLAGLAERDARRSCVPSGWTPIELVWHLAHVERRWLHWGFAAEPVDEPWGDEGPDGTWTVPPERDLADVLAFHRAQCARSREVVAAARLGDRAAAGGRFPADEDRPTLTWILLHLLQEYARHVGQLDVARELLDGAVGE